MALNTNPIYSGVGDVQWSTVMTAANLSLDATLANAYTVFSASISGSFIQRVRFKASGSGGTSPTVARIFINNGGASGSVGNNSLFDEITLPATSTSNTAATAVYELPMNIAIPAAYRILATIAVAQTNSGWYATAIGGSYTTP